MEGKKKDLWFIGIAFISILYFFAVSIILGMNLWYSPPSPELKLNEIGDYLAGAFSPLAFFWLAYGYWMQNKELKNSVENTSQALNLSGQQLEFQEGIKKYESTLTHNRNQPLFSILPDLNSEGDLLITITNYGNTIFALYVKLVESKDETKAKLYKEIFEHRDTEKIVINNDEIEKHNSELKFQIKFIDGAYQNQEVELDIKNDPKDHPYPFSSSFIQSTKTLPKLPALKK